MSEWKLKYKAQNTELEVTQKIQNMGERERRKIICETHIRAKSQKRLRCCLMLNFNITCILWWSYNDKPIDSNFNINKHTRTCECKHSFSSGVNNFYKWIMEFLHKESYFHNCWHFVSRLTRTHTLDTSTSSISNEKITTKMLTRNDISLSIMKMKPAWITCISFLY